MKTKDKIKNGQTGDVEKFGPKLERFGPKLLDPFARHDDDDDDEGDDEEPDEFPDEYPDEDP